MLALESTAKMRPLLENQEKIEKETASKRGDRQRLSNLRKTHTCTCTIAHAHTQRTNMKFFVFYPPIKHRGRFRRERQVKMKFKRE